MGVTISDGTATEAEVDTKALVEALLATSGALVDLAVRSLSACRHDMTLPQYRVLVALCVSGPLRVAEVADAVSVTPSNGTRICDRLAQKGLVRRSRSPADRRAVTISVTPAGREVVGDVGAARRVVMSRIVQEMPAAGHAQFIEGLKAFSHAAGDTSEKEWAVGWGQ